MFTDQEEKLATEGRQKYRGTARILLEVLHFPQDEPWQLDQKKVERLIVCFGDGKCDRVLRNHIPAVIDQPQLDSVLRDSQVSPESLLSNRDPHPFLKFPAGFQLHCLHGRHRIAAAKKALTPRDKWWTVDLYLADANYELKTALIEEYANEKPPTDGEIYCKIQKYRIERNSYSETRWWARLSIHQTRCLNDLIRHTKLKAAFDDLLDIPGLWGGMRISTLNKMVSMRCDEEVLAYLKHIKDVWSQILGHNEQAMRMVDHDTVRALELTAPKHSREDAQKLHGQLISGQIFATFTLQDRESIWTVLRTVPGLIPSLFTFFKDLIYLRACAGSLRHLIEPNTKKTKRKALDEMFFGDTDSWDSAYRSVWLYAMQFYRDLPAPPRETNKKLLAKGMTKRPDEVVLSDFATLADRLGFRSDQIEALKHRSSDREIARAALLNARKTDRYEYSDHILESHIDQIVSLFATATPLTVKDPCPAFVNDDSAASGFKCGFPDNEAYARDAKFLSVANLHVDVHEQGKAISSFFVRRSVYFAFFGFPRETRNHVRSRPSSAPIVEEVDSFSLFQEPRSDPIRGRGGEEQGLLERRQREQDMQVTVDNRTNVRERSLDLQELVESYQDLIETDRQHDETPDQQLQVISLPPSWVRIEFKIHERDVWRTDRSLLVDPTDPSEVERVAKKYMRKGIRPFDSSLRLLVPRTCFQAATADGSNTILLIPEKSIQVNSQQLVKFVPEASADTEQRAMPKRNRK